MPKKFIKCVKKVGKATMKRYGYMKYNPYAVCRVATGYYGPTRGSGIIHKVHPRCHSCKKYSCPHHPRKISKYLTG